MRHLVCLGALLLALIPPGVQAGRRPFIWTWDTQIVPQGDLELETWLWGRGRTAERPTRLGTNWIWWGPVYGVNDHLEVAVPFQLAANRERTWLQSFELDTRIRLLPREETAFATPLIRLAYHHGIPRAAPSRLDGNFVLRLGEAEGPYGNLELGGQLSIPGLRGGAGDTSLLLTWAGGMAVPLDEGRYTFAIETFGEVPTFGSAETDVHGFIGPSVGITRGRMWATLGVLIGLTSFFPDTPQFMPRLIWAVAL